MSQPECRVIFFGSPRVAEGNGIIVEEGQIMDSTILATRMTNYTKGGTFVSDGGKSLGGIGRNWPPLEEPVWGRATDVEVTLRATSFTLLIGLFGIINIESDVSGGSERVKNIYWNEHTEELVILTEKEKWLK
ncbi:unnamed protein product [marine sediment metagenome]|uniref:Uncharacterized protein n=1 Tax=marine sediment metagenome TaxID=412755 RepID=X1I7Y7_9ZZZZ